jgi:hypothetical protein
MKKNVHKGKETITPLFCDFSCPYARFSPPDSSGACRKELSVWCTKIKKFNNKNNKCLCTENFIYKREKKN